MSRDDLRILAAEKGEAMTARIKTYVTYAEIIYHGNIFIRARSKKVAKELITNLGPKMSLLFDDAVKVEQDDEPTRWVMLTPMTEE